jgi:glycosyltransferase involved in cell wall biosynthesis
MKASVIVPVYQVEKYIADTIQSVLNQTYQNFELVIVDDGSSDRSINICQQFQDPRITILRQPNQGVCVARNTGINHATGEYIALLDGDDLWLPEKLEKHIIHLQKNPRVGVNFSRSAFIDEKGKALGIYQMPKLTKITPASIIRRNPIGNGSAPVIRREVFKAIKYQDKVMGIIKNCYFDPKLAHFEDVECWLRIALLTDWQTEGIPEPLTLYRVNSQGASTNLDKQVEDLEKVLAKTKEYAPDLIREHGDAAKAYEIRKLARWAVRLKSASTAVQMAHKALFTYWKMIFEEPKKTLVTLAAAYSLYLLPKQFYNSIENLALQITSFTQKRRINSSKRDP